MRSTGSTSTAVLERTIDVLVGRLRDRLGDAADAPRFIVTVRGVGYRAGVGPVPTGAVPAAGAVRR